MLKRIRTHTLSKEIKKNCLKYLKAQLKKLCFVLMILHFFMIARLF